MNYFKANFNFQKYILYIFTEYYKFLAAGESEKAKNLYIYTKSLNLKDEYLDILNGIKAFYLKEYSNSIKLFNQSIQILPTKHAYLFKGIFLEDLYKNNLDFPNENHFICFINAIKIDPYFFPAWQSLKNAYYASDEQGLEGFDEEKIYFQKVINGTNSLSKKIKNIKSYRINNELDKFNFNIQQLYEEVFNGENKYIEKPIWAKAIKFLYKENPNDILLFKEYGKILEKQDIELAKEFYLHSLLNPKFCSISKKALHNILKAQTRAQPYSLLALSSIKLLQSKNILFPEIEKSLEDMTSPYFIGIKKAVEESRHAYFNNLTHLKSSSTWQEYVSTRKNKITLAVS
ncbi:MAG: hypothetical protein ACK4OM_07950 [Alphaproteobacteria bacterium]